MIVETPGIGQGDAGIVPYVDVSLYVMTPEFGAASQLEKIDMLDFADAVAINKFERRGAEDARRDVARQLVRNREAFSSTWEDMPVFGTSAARFADDGVTALYQYLRGLLVERGLPVAGGVLPAVSTRQPTGLTTIVPPARSRYLAEIAETVRGYHRTTAQQAHAARRVQQVRATAALLEDAGAEVSAVQTLLAACEADVRTDVRQALDEWPDIRSSYAQDELVVTVRDRELHTQLWRTTLSGSRIQLALIKAVLKEFFTEEAFAPLIDRARRLEKGIADVIIKHGVPWHVTRVGARVEFMCCPERPKNGFEASKVIHRPIDEAVHHFLLNRGVVITPFHNMMLICPATTDAHVETLISGLDRCLADLKS